MKTSTTDEKEGKMETSTTDELVIKLLKEVEGLIGELLEARDKAQVSVLAEFENEIDKSVKALIAKF